MLEIKNLFAEIPDTLPGEVIQVLLQAESFRLERIVSHGQATPPGEWYDQETAEWVLLLKGSAGIRFEKDPEVHVIGPGDFLLIPAHLRHRVEWTETEGKTVWLALHYVDQKDPK